MPEDLSPAIEPEAVVAAPRRPRKKPAVPPVETEKPRRRRTRTAAIADTEPVAAEATAAEDEECAKDPVAAWDGALERTETAAPADPAAEPDPQELFEVEDAGPAPADETSSAVEEAAEQPGLVEPAAGDVMPASALFAKEPADDDASLDGLPDPGEAFLPDPAESAPDVEEQDPPVVFADAVFPQDPPAVLEEPVETGTAAPEGVEQEDMAMPEPMAPDVEFGDGRREPVFSDAQESPALELEPLTAPPDNGPPLMLLGEASPEENPAQDVSGNAAAPSSKAWGPVRGAIEAALANLGPLLPISRAEQLRRQVADALHVQLTKIAGLAGSLVFARLPWLKRIGALVPHRRSTLIGGGLLVAAAAGGAGVRLLLPGAPVTVPAPVASAVQLPSHVARRLGQELEMSVVPLPKGTTALFATGADQLDSALALSRRQAAGDGIVISLDALAGASRRVLAWYGLASVVTVKPAPGPTLTFQGDIPDSLYPLAQAALDNIGQLLGRDPILHTVQIRDQIGKSDTVLLRAIFIGAPKSIVYTADGAREIGQAFYGGFAIREIDSDAVVLVPAQSGSGITVTIPLREPSSATVQGPPLDALPDRSAIVLAQESLPTKE